jgi:hypothetical protein
MVALCRSITHGKGYNMSNDPETTSYYLRATDPTTNEQVAFECVGLAVANAKAAELRMGGYRDVILSLAKAPQADNPAS